MGRSWHTVAERQPEISLVSLWCGPARAATKNDSRERPRSLLFGTRHPVGEGVTQHGGGAPGKKPLEPVGIQLFQNLLRMNESCDNRSDIRTVLFRSTPCSK